MRLSINRQEEAAVEKGWQLDQRAWKALQLIASEFETDPMSVQCFDLRLVKETIELVKAAQEIEPRLPVMSQGRRL